MSGLGEYHLVPEQRWTESYACESQGTALVVLMIFSLLQGILGRPAESSRWPYDGDDCGCHF